MKQQLTGIVISNKMQKTAVVKVSRLKNTQNILNVIWFQSIIMPMMSKKPARLAIPL